MDYATFLNRVIEEGSEAARQDYAEKPDKLKGAVDGFEACRGKSPAELFELLSKARKATMEAHREGVENYWEIRCFEAEIEWTCNVVSAMMVNEGQKPIVAVTARGMMKAAEILGTKL